MKRSFSALFVLLTALSGPLVFTPPAISRQDSSVNSEDEPEGAALSRTEADQPKCLFPPESGGAPEDLVVIPEDFDYEIYNESNQCEIEQNAASERLRNDTSPAIRSSTDPIENASGYGLENLCLPFAEYTADLEPWEGPAIAGSEPLDPTENLDCEHAAAEFLAIEEQLEETTRDQLSDWVLNAYYEKSYAISIGIRLALQDVAYSVLSSLHWSNNVSIFQAENILDSAAELGVHSYRHCASEFESISQMLTQSQLKETAKAMPTPPYCECWALDERGIESGFDGAVESVAPTNGTFAPGLLGVVEGIAPDSTLGCLESCEIAQNNVPNDAFRQHFEGVVEQAGEPLIIDLAALKNAVEAIWNTGKEQVETLERLSRVYEFEPNRTNELRFVSP